jgi:hypothetical protein
MIDPITCPHCREQLDIPREYRGRAVRCANCQNVVEPTATSPAPVPMEPRSEPVNRERPRQRRSEFDDRPRRQSNAIVWILFALTTLICGSIAASCFGISLWIYNPTMQPFQSVDGKFSIEFPDEPAPQTAKERAGAGLTVTAFRAQQQERYVVKYYPIPAKYRLLSDDEKLHEILKDERNTESAGEETRRQSSEHDGFPALDIMASTGQGILNRRNTIFRCVLVGPNVYVVLAQGSSLEPQVWWIRKYFTSFTIMDRTAKRPIEAKPDDGAKNQD